MTDLIEILKIFVDNIVPILLIAGVGFIVGRQFNVDPKPVSTVIFYLLSPSLVFVLLVESNIGGGDFAKVFVMTITLQLIMVTLAYLLGRAQTTTPVERANLMLSAFMLNAGNFGLSLIAFAFEDRPEVLGWAVVVFVSNVTMNYSMGVFVASNGRADWKASLINVAQTPAIYGVVLAFLIRGTDATVPASIWRAVSRLADAAIPMMLVLLGLQLGRSAQIKNVRLVMTGATLRLLVSPLVALGLVAIFGLDADARVAFILQTSMPTAVLSVVMATQFDLDRDLGLNLVMATTLLCPISLSVLIFLLR